MHPSLISGQKLLAGGNHVPSSEDAQVVLVGGCFDVVHYGHLHFLQRAKAAGDILVVALENDDFIKLHKRRVPFHTQSQRAEVLTHLRSVDYVILLPTMRGDTDYQKLVEIVHPAVIAITHGDPQKMKKKDFALAVGARLIEIDHIKGLSTTTILTYAHLLHD